MDKTKIRNFAIIAHIDHGKSTLADRILEITNAVSAKELRSQHLDSMDLEQERGITIKLNAVQLKYKDYIFHLIDTPGHVDFTYEVSRSLAACDGAILLVDATQGVQAQTISNVFLAIECGLTIIPVINKIDLPTADVVSVQNEIQDLLGVKTEDILLVSAKTGRNVEVLLSAVIDKISPPLSEDRQPLRALVFDSFFDKYRGVILLICIKEGVLNMGDEFEFMSTHKTFKVVELGIRTPYEVKKDVLVSGEVGWVAASIRSAVEVTIGDTITKTTDPASAPLPGYKKVMPVVFTGLYPIDSRDFQMLKRALEKITLSDSSVTFQPESSLALGFGFRLGLMGFLHLEVIQERLEREFNLELIATTPSVEIKVITTQGETLMISNPAFLPDKTKIQAIFEPYVQAVIIVPEKYLGSVMEICKNKRGVFQNMDLVTDRYRLSYELPLLEIVFDFFDKIKSASRGYVSFHYEHSGFKKSDLVKIDFLLNKEKVDALSFICHKDFVYDRAKVITQKLKEVVPRHSFEIPVQAVVGSKVISRETIKAYRKDVTAKLYGGDVTRRQKLLEKQKKGKARMKAFGRVQIPQEAFLVIMKGKTGN